MSERSSSPQHHVERPAEPPPEHPVERLAEDPAAGRAPAGLAPLDRGTDPWPGGFHTVRGSRLYVRHVDAAARPGTVGGDPRPLAVLLHGLGGSSLNWTDLGHVLAPSVASLAPDLPGFGRSDPPADGDYALEATADTVIAYLETVIATSGRDRIHLIGNSLGGAIAVRVAMLRPDLVRSLTLISPAFPDLRPRLRRLKFLPLSLVRIPLLGPAGFRRVAGSHPERQVRATLAEILVDPGALGPVRERQAVAAAAERAAQPWAADALSGSFTALVRSWIAGLGAAHWAAARSVAAPTLVVWGARDLLVSAALAPVVTRHIRGATLLVFEDAGHVAQMERPRDTARAVLDLITAAEQTR